MTNPFKQKKSKFLFFLQNELPLNMAQSAIELLQVLENTFSAPVLDNLTIKHNGFKNFLPPVKKTNDTIDSFLNIPNEIYTLAYLLNVTGNQLQDFTKRINIFNLFITCITMPFCYLLYKITHTPHFGFLGRIGLLTDFFSLIDSFQQIYHLYNKLTKTSYSFFHTFFSKKPKTPTSASKNKFYHFFTPPTVPIGLQTDSSNLFVCLMKMGNQIGAFEKLFSKEKEPSPKTSLPNKIKTMQSEVHHLATHLKEDFIPLLDDTSDMDIHDSFKKLFKKIKKFLLPILESLEDSVLRSAINLGDFSKQLKELIPQIKTDCKDGITETKKSINRFILTIYQLFDAIEIYCGFIPGLLSNHLLDPIFEFYYMGYSKATSESIRLESLFFIDERLEYLEKNLCTLEDDLETPFNPLLKLLLIEHKKYLLKLHNDFQTTSLLVC